MFTFGKSHACPSASELWLNFHLNIFRLMMMTITNIVPMYIEVEAETSNEPADMTFLPLTQLVLDLAILRDARLS